MNGAAAINKFIRTVTCVMHAKHTNCKNTIINGKWECKGEEDDQETDV